MTETLDQVARRVLADERLNVFRDARDTRSLARGYLVAMSDCYSCGQGMPGGECPNSQRECCHHCNHSWTHDSCCWCGPLGDRAFKPPEKRAVAHPGEERP